MEREDNQWREKFDRREQEIAALDTRIAECDRKSTECRNKMEKLKRTGRFQAASLESEMHKLLGVDAKILEAREKLTREREKITNNEAWMHYLITVGSAMVEKYKEAPVAEQPEVVCSMPGLQMSAAKRKRKVDAFLDSDVFYRDFQDKLQKRVRSAAIPRAEMDNCAKCGGKMLYQQSEAIWVCPGGCGYCVRGLWDERSELSALRELQELSPSSYLRVGHWHEFVKRLFWLENKEMPESIVQSVNQEYIRENKRWEDVNNNQTRIYLKRIGKSNLYAHSTQITYRILGRNPVRPTQDELDLMNKRFRQCQQPWEVCPVSVRGSRTNFPPNQYVAWQICAMEGLEFAFVLLKKLKSDKKIEQINKIWQYFCQCNRWIYTPLRKHDDQRQLEFATQ